MFLRRRERETVPTVAPEAAPATPPTWSPARASSLPEELQAWRSARARARGEGTDSPPVPSDSSRAPLDEADTPTRPGSLTMHGVAQSAAAAGAASHTAQGLRAGRSGPDRADAPGARRAPAGAPVEPLAGSPVEFLLSDMGQWPAEGQKSRASPARMADDEASRAGPVSLLPDGSEPSFVASAQRRAFWASRPVRIVLCLGAVLLLLVLGLQVALTHRSWLAAHAPATAPALNALCAPLGCAVAPYRDLDAIVIDSSAFNRMGAASFRFAVTLRNQSNVAVATPALELTLTDAMEQPVVRRVVSAAELRAPPSLGARGEFAGASALELIGVDNASAITGYRVVAFYP